MRTSLEIDDQLLQQAMRCSGLPTKKAAVEAGLRLLLQTHSQTAIRKLSGKVAFEPAPNPGSATSEGIHAKEEKSI